MIFQLGDAIFLRSGGPGRTLFERACSRGKGPAGDALGCFRYSPKWTPVPGNAKEILVDIHQVFKGPQIKWTRTSAPRTRLWLRERLGQRSRVRDFTSEVVFEILLQPSN